MKYDMVPMIGLNHMCIHPPTSEHMQVNMLLNEMISDGLESIAGDYLIDDLLNELELLIQAYISIINENESIPIRYWLDNIHIIEYRDGKFYNVIMLDYIKDKLNYLKDMFVEKCIENADIFLITIDVFVKGEPAFILHPPI